MPGFEESLLLLKKLRALNFFTIISRYMPSFTILSDIYSSFLEELCNVLRYEYGYSEIYIHSNFCVNQSVAQSQFQG